MENKIGRPIKMIIFDLGKVLLKENKLYNTEITNVGRRLAQISYESMYDSNFKTELAEISNEYHVDEFYLKESLKNYFYNKYQVNMTIQEIQNLSIKYKLGIGSNFISDIYQVLENYHKYFSLACISGWMEVEKPNRKFFDILLKEASYLQVFPDEILFIDDKKENLEMASSLNMITMQYNNEDDNEFSLYETIIKFIDNLNTIKNKYYHINSEFDSKSVDKKYVVNPKTKDLLDNHKIISSYNEICVGTIPVLDTYGFKPTEPTHNELENLKDITGEENYFNEELIKTLSEVSDSEKITKKDIYPVYLLLSYGHTTLGKIIKKFTKDTYTHISLTFDDKLEDMYSFDKNGFSNETIKDPKTYSKIDDYKYSLYATFVNQDEKNLMLKFINKFKENAKNYKYNNIGLIKNFFGKECDENENKKFCSQFVAEILRAGKKDILTKDPSLYRPYEMRKIKNFFFIQKGFLKNYNSSKTKKRINLILEKLQKKTELNEALRDYLKISNNSLLIRYKKIDYKEEYNKSHRLLKISKANKNIKVIKDELCKLWSYYLIIEELFIQKGKNQPAFRNTKEYKDSVVAKAFILGDIKEYLNFIYKYEPEFNFSEYYQNSSYNKDAVIITKKDIQSLIKLIKEILI